MSRIIFNLAAKSEAAGRTQNEDSYWVCPDLAKWSATIDKVVGTDEDVELSDKGALLVVADGMGGMNAGEVASKLIVEGVKNKFSNIPESILTDEEKIKRFIHAAIVEADESVKQYAKDHREAEGLGSTIVLLWLLNGRAFCGWCGDSRIYRFNPNNELVRLSHDHSYVQQLVDDGKISEDEAFDHPDGNIISKALGDNGNKADPEIRAYDVYSRDVFMLCSDGLCGLLQDSELNEIISRDCTSSKETLKYLWQKGEEKGWTDNASIDVLCVVDGGKTAKGLPDGYPIVAKKSAERKANPKQQASPKEGEPAPKKLKPLFWLLSILIIGVVGIALFKMFDSGKTEEPTNQEFYVDTQTNNNTTPDGNESQQSTANDQTANSQQNNGTGNAQNGRNNGQATTAQPPANTNNNEPASSGQIAQSVLQQSANNQNSTAQNSSTANDAQDIDYINESQNSAAQNGNQTPHPAEFHPSVEYMRLYQTVLNDYNKAAAEYKKVRKQGYRTSSSDAIINHFMNNIDNNLRSLTDDRKNFDALGSSQKAAINKFSMLANDIYVDYKNYRIKKSRKRDDADNGYDPIYPEI